MIRSLAVVRAVRGNPDLVAVFVLAEPLRKMRCGVLVLRQYASSDVHLASKVSTKAYENLQKFGSGPVDNMRNITEFSNFRKG